MPPRNNPLPTAVRLFKCALCNKDYSRQIEYENHLRSYDHNHRARLANMKKLTASNDTEGSKPKPGLEMRTIDVENANKKPGVGSRFTKIGGGGAGFKKVGVAVSSKESGCEEEDASVKAENVPVDSVEQVPVAATMPSVQANINNEEDADMAEDDEDEDITWEEYDFTKPTGCDHTTCSGCKTDGIWSGDQRHKSLKNPVSDFVPGLTLSIVLWQRYHADDHLSVMFNEMNTRVARLYAPVVSSLCKLSSTCICRILSPRGTLADYETPYTAPLLHVTMRGSENGTVCDDPSFAGRAHFLESEF
ncbi:Zinc finger C2H2 [Pyrenophora seminiperda CCB06]|uniref:Zinc finger C2H2 n=1 Tax=Pyrenophora seminiperda CCB06 TaxID=1302712 RepID=A0A3M7MAN3_9PLEO|nr:Zinc finger C2H2 [Pyrenophora seminiperda CCB06]